MMMIWMLRSPRGNKFYLHSHVNSSSAAAVVRGARPGSASATEVSVEKILLILHHSFHLNSVADAKCEQFLNRGFERYREYFTRYRRLRVPKRPTPLRLFGPYKQR